MTGYRERSFPQRYTIVCFKCGKEDSLPFEPSPTKKYLCKRCHDEYRTRPMFKAVCSQCGEECEVPFQPDPNRRLLCPECYRTERDRYKDKSI